MFEFKVILSWILIVHFKAKYNMLINPKITSQFSPRGLIIWEITEAVILSYIKSPRHGSIAIDGTHFFPILCPIFVIMKTGSSTIHQHVVLHLKIDLKFDVKFMLKL